jgi:hypothetical protein
MEKDSEMKKVGLNLLNNEITKIKKAGHCPTFFPQILP